METLRWYVRTVRHAWHKRHRSTRTTTRTRTAYELEDADVPWRALSDQTTFLCRLSDRLTWATHMEVHRARGLAIAQVLCQWPGVRTILDVGTHAGVTSASVTEFAPHLMWIGLDASASACQSAHRHCSATMHIVQGDALALPVMDRSVDVVVTHSVLYTLDANLERVLAELRRVSRGPFCFIEPFYESIPWIQHLRIRHKAFTCPVLPRLASAGFHLTEYRPFSVSHHPARMYWVAAGYCHPLS